MKERNQSVDIVKGIGIILMIVGHSYSTDAGGLLLKWIYSFHMPIFFITTGVLAGGKGRNGGVNLKKKVQALLVPYFIYGTLYQLFLAALAILGGAPAVSTILYRIKLVLTLDGSAMWFLPAMFVASMLFSVTQKWRYGQIALAVLSMTIWICGPAVHGFFGCFFRALPGFAFIVVGYNLHSLYITKRKNAVFAAAILIHLAVTFTNMTVDLAYHTIGNPLWYIIESIIGAFVVYQFVLRLNAKHFKAVALIGRYSVVFLCLHGLVIQGIRLLDYKTLQVFSRLGWAEGPALAFVVTVIIYVFIPCVCKYMGWSFGIKGKADKKECGDAELLSK